MQSDDVATLCSTGSQQIIDVPDIVNAIHRCCANAERAKCELLQPRPRPGRLVFLASGVPLRPPPRLSFSSRCFLPRFLSSFFPTSWVRHTHHASTSPSSTLLLTRVCPPSIPPLLASGPTFSAAAMSQLCYRRQARLPRETISLCRSASPPVEDAVGRLALSASTSSRIIAVWFIVYRKLLDVQSNFLTEITLV